MDRATARELTALNNRFYAENATSFSATRNAPWDGWAQCLDIVRHELGFDGVASQGSVSGACCAEGRRDAKSAGCSQQARVRPTTCVSLLSQRAGDGLAECSPTLRVLDVACGNLRFEGFLARELPGVACECFAVDSCEALAGSTLPDAAAWKQAVRFRQLDVLACLAEAGDRSGAADCGSKHVEKAPRALSLVHRLTAAFAVPPCDAAVCFGFMHHVPVPEWREALLRALVECVRPGGIVCISFWRFLDHPPLARKADEVTARAAEDAQLARLVGAFDPGDRLLGWQDRQDSFRYCHHFSGAEIDALAASVAGRAHPIARFRADGRSGDLNDYLVLQV